ncbi:MAG: formate dehydrogenase subunit gamma [Terriglobia bacterium]
MTKYFALVRSAVGALALAVIVAMAASASAQQPSSVNPNASAVQEQQLMHQLRAIQGLGTIPDKKSYVLEHPAGRDWRAFHNVTLRWIGGIAILGMIALLVIFYLWRGSMKVRAGYSDTTILRFNAFERFVHWLTAVSFIILGITGLNITFGRPLLLPWMGAEAFSTWSEWAKYSHNYLSFAFTIGVALMFLMWVAENFPTAADGEWLKLGGGMFDKKDKTHPPARKFNAGQKILYWLVILASAAMMISGFMLMFPFYGGLTIGNMELAEIFHGVVAVLFVSLILAHIYLGTIGMEGAFDAMGDGNVDLNWAKEHHNLWVEEEVHADSTRGAIRPAE